jgi:hypothetical protein
MNGKRLTIGDAEYGIEDKTVDTVVEQVKNAMQNGAVASLPLLDGKGRPVTVYLNGKVATTVVVDLDGDPRPSEIC